MERDESLLTASGFGKKNTPSYSAKPILYSVLFRDYDLY